jgi:hypothetical protein
VPSANVLILAPVGRDAGVCATLVEQAGLAARVCSDVSDLIAQLDVHADVVLVTEEALYGKALDPLEAWVTAQPPWSDLPFVVLTNHNESTRFAQFRSNLVHKLAIPARLSRANQAAAFDRISRSSLSWRFSRLSRLSSSRSAVVRPPPLLRRPASRSVRPTQFLIDCAVGSNSRASSSGERPARTSSTIWRRNSGL